MQHTPPDLRIASREGGNARGQEVMEQILRAALSILVEDGMEAFTMRRVAAAANMQLGNIAYYFKSKQELLDALIDAMAGGYEDVSHALANQPDRTAEDKLRDIVSWTIRDITSKRASRLLPQLSYLSSFKDAIRTRIERLYIIEHNIMTDLIKAINPRISEHQVEDIAVLITASLEGFTAYVGYERPWNDRIAELEELAIESFIALIKSR